MIPSHLFLMDSRLMEIGKPANHQELRKALGLLLAQEGENQRDLETRIDGLVNYSKRRQFSLEHCLIARDKGCPVTACLLIDFPGRMSNLFLPNLPQFLQPTQLMSHLAEESISSAHARGIQIVQSMINPEAIFEPSILEQAGLRRLAELIYLDSDLSRSILTHECSHRLKWKTYSDSTHGLFAQILQDTYVNSHDCVALNGIRRVDDIIDSHRATGEFDPNLWFVGFADGSPVGILLLNFQPERWAMEVVYMGLLPSCRGKGYGAALLSHAVTLARQRAIFMLTLSVDAQNAPAIRLYQSFGFQETWRRAAWFHVHEGA